MLTRRIPDNARATSSNDGAEITPAELPTYAALIGLFNAALALFLFFRSKSPAREEPTTGDLLLLGLATQKASRVLTRAKVTHPLRAPFTEVEGSAGAGELDERPRGTGMRKTIGQLLTCPYCLGMWIASGFVYGFTFEPRMTRMVASIFAVSSIADFTQHGYVKAKEMTD
ncbi:MAG: hypothetical protein DLM52_02125 [Chthoniobacterales bacterium]|nr:MAG: hypothetical protein DLM52_02125 [Chthoniobacterales bacterium]